MPTAITKYVATDGTEHPTFDAAAAHEILESRCRCALLPLGAERRIDHGKYVQHQREDCLQAKRNMLVILRERFKGGDYKVFSNPDDDIHPSSFVGRLASECCRPISRAWGRLMRIDMATGREYDQPYFVAHPGEGEGEMK